jgi:hypothetical protein
MIFLCSDVQLSPLSCPSVLSSTTFNRASAAHSLHAFFALALHSFAEYYCLSAQLFFDMSPQGHQVANADATPR